jgi:TorA maturation chaperone TorD
MTQGAHAVHKAAAVAEEDQLRADLYALLGVLLARPPSPEVLNMCAGLSGDDSAMGKAIGSLARIAGNITPETVNREFHDLFIGLGRGELLPYASFYLTGFLHEKPLAKLRSDMNALGIARVEDVREPEDNIASLMDMMSGMITGRYGVVRSLGEQRAFFDAHIARWAGHFFADLEGAQTSVFYAPVGTIGGLFMGIEETAFRMDAA